MGKMYFLIVDLIRSEKYGLNSTESNLCSVLNFLISRKSMSVDGEEFYLADYDFVANLCHLLPEKKDTLQRLYKKIENAGLIKTIKIGKHLYFTPSDDLRDWGNQFDNIESADTEKNPSDTEKNPSDTEKNPSDTEKNPSSLYIGIDKEEDKEIDKNDDKESGAKTDFSPTSPRSTKIKFSRENGLTPANLNVRQSTIDKIDSAFEQLIFPIDDLEIKRLYFVLCCSPKWRNKTVHAMQMSLNKVQNYDKEFTKKLIEDSIAGGWQGLVFEDTDKKYQNYLRSRGSVALGGKTTFKPMSEEERKEAMEYLNM